MASRSNRQRRLERARAERRLAHQAHQARRRRQIQAGIGASVALLVIILATTWLLGGFDPDPPAETAATPSCAWNPQDPATNPNLTDVGTPPSTGELRSGFEQLTIETNLGQIDALVDLSRVPCTAASLGFLGEKDFYANSTCHLLSTTSMILACGDPKSDGTGGPTYQFADENVPTIPVPADPAATSNPTASASPVTTYYAKGTLVMANNGPNTNGSQFAIVYGDGSDLPPAYTNVGTVTAGLEIVEGVARAGAVDAQGQPAADGMPTTALTITRLYLGSAAPAPSASTAPEPTPAATPSPSPSA